MEELINCSARLNWITIGYMSLQNNYIFLISYAKHLQYYKIIILFLKYTSTIMIMNTWIENMVHKISDLGIAPVPVIDNCLLQDNIYRKTGCYRVPELNSNQKARLNSQGPLSTLDNGFQVQ